MKWTALFVAAVVLVACGTITPSNPDGGGPSGPGTGKGGAAGTGSGGGAGSMAGTGGAATGGAGGTATGGAGGTATGGAAGAGTGGGGVSGTGGTGGVIVGTGGAGGGGGTGGVTVGTGGAGGGGGTGGASGAGGVTGTGGGAAGSGGASGAGGAGMPCPGCTLEVTYTCRSSETIEMSMVLDVLNLSSATLRLSDITVRYWFTTDDVPDQIAVCDFAAVMCTSVLSSFSAVSPARSGASAFLEIGFAAAAGTVAPGGDSGQIQLRVHTGSTYLPITQTDDYSFDCSNMGVSMPAPKITAYYQGTLVWGTQP